MFAKVHQTLSTVNTNLFGASEIFERKDIKRAMVSCNAKNCIKVALGMS